MRKFLALMGSVALMIAAGSVLAGEAAEITDEIVSDQPAGEKTCLLLRSIDHTDVVDDYTILFYTRGRDVYVSRLPNRCPGLRIADSFMYATSLNVLCDLDVIRPLRNIGAKPSPGVACGLGRFQPITEDEIDILKNGDVEVDPDAAMPEIEDIADTE